MTDAETQTESGLTGRTRRSSSRDRDWTKGSIVSNLLALSWPIIISDSLNLMGPTIDMIWVGRLGVASIAGVGISGMALTVVGLLTRGFQTGMRAMVARFAGSGDTKEAISVSQQALVVSGVYAITMGTIGVIFAEPILTLLGVEPNVVSEGAAYLRIMFIGTMATSFHTFGEGVMQSSGDTVTPMKISIISRIAHVILCPFLVFGWWMFPRLGVSGAATSSVATQGLAMTLALWVVFSGQSRLRLTLRDFRLDLSVIWRMVKIGLPASVTMAQQSFGRIVLMLFIIPFGTFAVAAHSLLERIDLFIRMPALGFGRAASVLVGQTLGAQQPERAEKSTWFAMGLSEGILVISAIILFLWPGSIIRIFNSDPDLVEIASVFLRIGVIGYLTIGFDAVLGQSLTGAGDTLPPMLITLLRLWVVTIPLSYLIPRVTELGVYGIRWSIVIGMVVGTAAYLVYFRLGRWKRKRI